MERLIKILKRELRRLPRLVIAFIGLAITLVASVVAYPFYLCSRLSRNNKQSINTKET